MEEDYREIYDDLCVQTLTFDKVYAQSDLENRIMKFCSSLGTMALGYSGSGRKYKVYTSEKFTSFVNKLEIGTYLHDVNGDEHKIEDSSPRFISQQLCIETRKKGCGRDMYDLTCFRPQTPKYLCDEDEKHFRERFSRMDRMDIDEELQHIKPDIYHYRNARQIEKAIEQIATDVLIQRGIF